MRSHPHGEGRQPLPLARTVRRRLIAWLVACVPLLILLQIAQADEQTQLEPVAFDHAHQ